MKRTVRVEVLSRDRYRCRGCLHDSGEIHHILFRSQGGQDTSGNLITLCPSCHRRAHGTNGRQIDPEVLYAMIDQDIFTWERAEKELGRDLHVDSRLRQTPP